MRNPVAIGLAIGLAIAISTIGMIVLFLRAPAMPDGLIIALATAICIVPIAAVLLMLTRRPAGSAAAETVQIAGPDGWLELEWEPPSLVGDAQALERLGAECIRIARAANHAGTATLS